jgi:hypothetical protein
MPASIEHQLISKIIEVGELRQVLDCGISAKNFGVLEARMLFEYIHKYFYGHDTRNIVPDLDLVKKKFPTVDIPNPPKRLTIKALCKEVMTDWVRRQIEGLLIRVEDTYDDDPMGTIDELSQELKDLQISSADNRDILLSTSGAELKREYLAAKNNEGYAGIPYPKGWGYCNKDGTPKLKANGIHHHDLNEQTGGMLNGEFILFYGRPKSMKTWLLVDVISEAYWENNCRCLVFSKEMTVEQMRKRTVARIIRADYMALKNGTLDLEKEEELWCFIENLVEEERRFRKHGKKCGLLFTSGWQRGSVRSSLDSLQAKIEEFEPELVGVDALYMMGDPKSRTAFHQQIYDIAYGIKDIAQHYKIPVVCTTQANRKGEETKGSTMAEIAYGDALAQACDLACRLIKREAEDGSTKIACIISGGREINLAGFLLDAAPATTFSLNQMFKSQLQIQAQFKAEEEAIAREEQNASDKLAKKRFLNQENFQKRDPSQGDGVK